MSKPGNDGLFDIRAFGARGEGNGNDGPAMQRAIDACAARGGGVVYAPPGVYLTGTLLLKSRVELHLEAGAILRGSPERADYTAQYNLPRDTGYVCEKGFPEHLIYARDAETIAITGRGTIDGNGRAFYGPLDPRNGRLTVPGWRPGQMLAFAHCRDVLLRDVRLMDAPYWTVWPLGCERVRIEGLVIANLRHGRNTDGLDIDCCSDVRIRDCAIDTGDDCIALRSDSFKAGADRACEDVVVSDCTLSSTTSGVRVGYVGDGPIRRCTLRGLKMRATRTGLCLQVPRHVAPDNNLQVVHGPAIEALRFDDIVMDTVLPLCLWIGPDAGPPGGIRGVTFERIEATAQRACFISGSPTNAMEDVRLRDWHLRVSGAMHDRYDGRVPYPQSLSDCDYCNCRPPALPFGLYARHVRRLGIRDARIEWGDVSGPWRSALRLEHIEAPDLRDIVAAPAPGAEDLPTIASDP